MKRLAALLPVSCALLVACGPRVSSATFMDVAPQPAGHEVRLFSTKLPTCPYEEIGVVRARRRAFASLQDVLSALTDRAREMGGDAVVGMGQTQSVSAGSIDDMVSVDTHEGLAGTVIRFTDPACTT